MDLVAQLFNRFFNQDYSFEGIFPFHKIKILQTKILYQIYLVVLIGQILSAITLCHNRLLVHLVKTNEQILIYMNVTKIEPSIHKFAQVFNLILF